MVCGALGLLSSACGEEVDFFYKVFRPSLRTLGLNWLPPCLWQALLQSLSKGMASEFHFHEITTWQPPPPHTHTAEAELEQPPGGYNVFPAGPHQSKC